MTFVLAFLLFIIAGGIIYFVSKRVDAMNSREKFTLGLGLSVILIGVFIIILLVLAGMTRTYIFTYPLFMAGLFQFAYIVPLSLFLFGLRQYDIIKGLITGALVIALLNGAFFFIVPFISKH